MNKTTITFLVVLLYSIMNSTVVHSQMNDSSDVLKTYRLEEVTIQAQRLSLQIGVSIEQLQRTDIEHLSANTLSEIITTRGGVFVKDYGGSGIKTISQRGLGTEHSVILLNGMRISSIQNGLMDLGMFPVEEIELLEIAQGGYSALVGADAIGGVVNIVTIPTLRQTNVRLTSSFGSFGEQEFSGRGSESIGNVHVRAGIGQQRCSGSFPFTFSNGNIIYNIERKNVDVRTNYGTLQTSWSLDEKNFLFGASYYYTSERGIGGLITGPVHESKARQTDDEGVFQILYHHLFERDFSFGLNTQLHHQYERYNDPLLNVAGKTLDNYFKNNELRIEPNVFFRSDSSFSLRVGGEIVKSLAEGNVLKNNTERNQYSSYLQVHYSLDLSTTILHSLTVVSSVRYDVVPTFITSFSPQVESGLRFERFEFLHSELTLRMNISKNFRVPTFNELYWSGGGGIGNPNLNPERADNFDGGVLLSFSFLGSHSLKATYYNITMSDRIIWTAAGSGMVTPKNVRSVSSYGIEASYQAQLFDELVALDMNYTNGKSIKTSADYSGDPTVNNQLPYVPEEMMNVAFSFNQKLDESFVSLVGLTLAHQFVGYRYTREDNSNYLPGNRLLDGNIRLRTNVGNTSVNLKVEVKNIFDQEYQIMPAYPMQMRSYRFSFSIELT